MQRCKIFNNLGNGCFEKKSRYTVKTTYHFRHLQRIKRIEDERDNLKKIAIVARINGAASLIYLKLYYRD